jgi:hypothetical protein
MKSYSFGLFLVLFLIGGMSMAQSRGLRAGYQSSTIKGDDVRQVNGLDNFYIGAFHVNDFGGFFGFYKGIEYFQAGIYNDDNNFKRVHTISVPLMLRAKIGPAFAQAGFGANFKVGESAQEFGEDLLSDDNRKSPFMDVPVLVGGGIKVLFMTIEARYGYGLLNATKLEDVDAHNSYWQIGLGFSL